MRVSASFREFVLDRLADVKGLRARAMFGCLGLYAGDCFFGIVADDVLYPRVDDTNRLDYERAGSMPSGSPGILQLSSKDSQCALDGGDPQVTKRSKRSDWIQGAFTLPHG